MAQAFNNRGISWRALGEIDRAISDFDSAVQVNPRHAVALNNRGACWRSKGDNERAQSDFNAAIAIDRRFGIAFYNRGILRYWQGNHAEAALDFAQAIQAPAGGYAAIWLYAARARSGVDGTTELAENARSLRSAAWPMPIVEFYLGRRTLQELMAAAGATRLTRRTEFQCEATFYAGQKRLSDGDGRGARKLLLNAKSLCPTDFVEYEAAIVELSASHSLGIEAPPRRQR